MLVVASLNPCCNGTYSPSVSVNTVDKVVSVLILVVMEHTLRELQTLFENLGKKVLILVVMEHTLRGY